MYHQCVLIEQMFTAVNAVAMKHIMEWFRLFKRLRAMAANEIFNTKWFNKSTSVSLTLKRPLSTKSTPQVFLHITGQLFSDFVKSCGVPCMVLCKSIRLRSVKSIYHG